MLIGQYTILRGAFKDFRVYPKSNKTSSYIEDHSGDIPTRDKSVSYSCTGAKTSSNSVNKGREIKDNLVKLANFKFLEWNLIYLVFFLSINL